MIDDFDVDFEPKKNPKLFQGLNVGLLLSGAGQAFECNVNAEDCEDTEIPEERLQDSFYLQRDIKDFRMDFAKTTFHDIALKMKNVDKAGMVKKILIKPGNGSPMNQEGTVVFHYSFYVENSNEPFDSTVMRNEICRVRFGQEVISGLTIAIGSMCKGETSHFLISWKQAFGSLGSPLRIPPEADIFAIIELVDIIPLGLEPEPEPKPLEDLSLFAQQMHSARKCQLVGKEAFKEKDYEKSMEEYYKGLKILKVLALGNKKEQMEKNSLINTFKLNLAVVHNKMGNFKKALAQCEGVLEKEPCNLKALLHSARAYINLNMLDEASKQAKKGLQEDPDCKELQNELKVIEKKKAGHQQAEKIIAQKMMSSISI